MKILLIEDDSDDIELLKDALDSHGLTYSIDIVTDGGKALDYIRNCKKCPDIIILDFNLPKVHGREIILEIKSVSSFKKIPLLILTTSSAREDIDFAYKNGADKYLTKPTDIKQINEMVKAVQLLAQKK